MRVFLIAGFLIAFASAVAQAQTDASKELALAAQPNARPGEDAFLRGMQAKS